MNSFDINDPVQRKIRACRTRAFTAELFAAYPRSPRMAQKWAEIARAWTEVADMQARAAKSHAAIARQLAEMKARVTPRAQS